MALDVRPSGRTPQSGGQRKSGIPSKIPSPSVARRSLRPNDAKSGAPECILPEGNAPAALPAPRDADAAPSTHYSADDDQLLQTVLECVDVLRHGVERLADDPPPEDPPARSRSHSADPAESPVNRDSASPGRAARGIINRGSGSPGRPGAARNGWSQPSSLSQASGSRASPGRVGNSPSSAGCRLPLGSDGTVSFSADAPHPASRPPPSKANNRASPARQVSPRKGSSLARGVPSTARCARFSPAREAFDPVPSNESGAPLTQFSRALVQQSARPLGERSNAHLRNSPLLSAAARLGATSRGLIAAPAPGPPEKLGAGRGKAAVEWRPGNSPLCSPHGCASASTSAGSSAGCECSSGASAVAAAVGAAVKPQARTARQPARSSQTIVRPPSAAGATSTSSMAELHARRPPATQPPSLQELQCETHNLDTSVRRAYEDRLASKDAEITLLREQLSHHMLQTSRLLLLQNEAEADELAQLDEEFNVRRTVQERREAYEARLRHEAPTFKAPSACSEHGAALAPPAPAMTPAASESVLSASGTQAQVKEDWEAEEALHSEPTIVSFRGHQAAEARYSSFAARYSHADSGGSPIYSSPRLSATPPTPAGSVLLIHSSANACGQHCITPPISLSPPCSIEDVVAPSLGASLSGIIHTVQEGLHDNECDMEGDSDSDSRTPKVGTRRLAAWLDPSAGSTTPLQTSARRPSGEDRARMKTPPPCRGRAAASPKAAAASGAASAAAARVSARRRAVGSARHGLPQAPQPPRPPAASPLVVAPYFAAGASTPTSAAGCPRPPSCGRPAAAEASARLPSPAGSPAASPPAHFRSMAGHTVPLCCGQATPPAPSVGLISTVHAASDTAAALRRPASMPSLYAVPARRCGRSA